jgi:predicted phage terminase large subunit-like protein
MRKSKANISSENQLKASLCRQSFFYFVQTFWDVIIPEKPVWNWHIKYLCDELQKIAERVFVSKPKEYDFICNVSPASSKSTVFSVMLCPWTWTRMPTMRHICGSHTDRLALRLSLKSRDIVRSEKYQTLFPGIEVRKDQDAKGGWANTLGGDRTICTVSGQSPIGLHAHMCLPPTSLIQTELGQIPIGKIVNDRMNIKVLGYDHGLDTPVWRNITRYYKLPSRSLCRITFNDESFLDITDNHPIFIVGKGYIIPKDICIGDEVFYDDSMQTMRQVDLSMPGSFEKKAKLGKGLGFLLKKMLFCFYNWRKSSKIQQNCKKLFGLWRRILGWGKCSKDKRILQLRMSRYSEEWGKQPTIQRAGKIDMRFLWSSYRNISMVGEKEKELLLLERVCKQRSFQENKWERQREIYSRNGRRISQGVLRDSESGERERWEYLLHMQQDLERKWEGSRSSSYRLGHGSQFYGEFSGSLHDMSQKTERETPKTPKVITKNVRSVEFMVRISEEVYNLGIEDTNNYFAGGVLVHNCTVDDPVDPETAESEAEIARANRWMNNTLRSRVVDKAIVPIILIMQRFSDRDPTAEWLDNPVGPLKHICLPAELTDDVKPEECRKFYSGDGLFDPVRLPKLELEKIELQGIYLYNSQYLQNPIPAGGAMFKKEWFNDKIVEVEPSGLRKFRFWDKAGCFVSGTMVTTLFGQKSIDEIGIGDFVLTREGFRKVVKSGVSKYTDDIISVIFDNGSILAGTKDHLVWTDNRKWVRLDSLCSSDIILTNRLDNVLCQKVQREDRTQNLLYSMALPTLEGQERDISKPISGMQNKRKTSQIFYTEQFGDSITETFPRASIYITRMETGIIIQLKILNVYPEASTCFSTEINLLHQNTKLFWRELDHWLLKHVQNYTKQREVRKFVEKEVKPHIKVQHIRNMNVSNVERSLNLEVIWPLNFADGNVDMNLGRSRKRNLLPVYDLEVDGKSEFFANGILVHNSTTRDAAFTCGTLVGADGNGRFYILDEVRGRWDSTERNGIIRSTAMFDGFEIRIGLEAEPGSGGKESAAISVKELVGYRVEVDRPVKNKEARADAFAAQCKAGNVFILKAEWTKAWIDEVCRFPFGKLKDRIDSTVAAFNHLILNTKVDLHKALDNLIAKIPPKGVAVSSEDPLPSTAEVGVQWFGTYEEYHVWKMVNGDKKFIFFSQKREEALFAVMLFGLDIRPQDMKDINEILDQRQKEIRLALGFTNRCQIEPQEIAIA